MESLDRAAGTYTAALLAVVVCLLCGCGPDTLGAAATTATAQAKAARQAQEQKAQIEKQIHDMQEADQKRVDGLDAKVDGAAR